MFFRIIAFFIFGLTIEAAPLKALHLSFHRGCLKEIEQVGGLCGVDLESLLILELKEYSLDPLTKGAALYNIDSKRAQRIWEAHKDYFEQFDLIITSDTAPLARIFLQNNFSKFLVIWVCNRFDYYDGATLDCDFPDREYYELFKEAKAKSNVRIIAYTPFERFYAKCKGVDIGKLLLKPSIGAATSKGKSAIPAHIDKKETFFIPYYHNDRIFMNLSKKCDELGIKNYCGYYNGPQDLKDFKGIVHIPYSWSNLALFENLSFGIPYFIPTERLLREFIDHGAFFPDVRFTGGDLALSEWYCPENSHLFVYFDSWEELAEKIEKTDLLPLREMIQFSSKCHQEDTLDGWKAIFLAAKEWKNQTER